MKSLVIFIVFLFISPTSIASGGFSFLMQQKWAVGPNENCGVLIDQLGELLFGLHGENEDLAKYYLVNCTPEGQSERELNVELLFESTQPADQVRLSEWVLTLKSLSFKGGNFEIFEVNKIFFSFYNFAYRLVAGFWQYLGGFETPMVANNFQTVYETKEKWKATFTEPNPYPFLQLLSKSMSARDWKVWYEQIIPQMERFESKIYVYYIIENDQVKKSSMIFQIERDCRTLKCK